jgi:hypothetical protein
MIGKGAVALISALCGAAIISTAWAQEQPAGPGPMRGEMAAKMQARRQADAQQRTQDLKTVLRLRPDQDAALAAFLQSAAPGPRPARGAERPAGPMTTPERADAMIRRGARRAADAQRRLEALKTFYAALSPDQRAVFDALARLRAGHDGMGRGHGGRPPRGRAMTPGRDQPGQ